MKPAAIIYCQHSLGLGHFVRSLTLAEALATDFDVVFLNGGPVPEGFDLPDTVRFLHLPPLRLEADGSLQGDGNVDEILARRRAMMCEAAARLRPALLVVELYPFGRKKFEVEIVPLIEIVRNDGGKIACSVRDILVTERVDQARHDERAAKRLNSHFDMVIIHADPALFDLTESFRPTAPVAIPLRYSGYVVRHACAVDAASSSATLVAAGGGAVGMPIYRAAVAAQAQLYERCGWPMTIVAGPLLPEAEWRELVALSKAVPGLTICRSVASMQPLIARSGRFAGQCGYNSALEILQARLPALFIPFARGQESEQRFRARKLQALGLAEWMADSDLSATAFAERLMRLAPPSAGQSLNLDGARNSAALLRALAL